MVFWERESIQDFCSSLLTPDWQPQGLIPAQSCHCDSSMILGLSFKNPFPETPSPLIIGSENIPRLELMTGNLHSNFKSARLIWQTRSWQFLEIEKQIDQILKRGGNVNTCQKVSIGFEQTPMEQNNIYWTDRILIILQLSSSPTS